MGIKQILSVMAFTLAYANSQPAPMRTEDFRPPVIPPPQIARAQYLQNQDPSLYSSMQKRLEESQGALQRAESASNLQRHIQLPLLESTKLSRGAPAPPNAQWPSSASSTDMQKKLDSFPIFPPIPALVPRPDSAPRQELAPVSAPRKEPAPTSGVPGEPVPTPAPREEPTTSSAVQEAPVPTPATPEEPVSTPAPQQEPAPILAPL